MNSDSLRSQNLQAINSQNCLDVHTHTHSHTRLSRANIRVQVTAPSDRAWIDARGKLESRTHSAL